MSQLKSATIAGTCRHLVVFGDSLSDNGIDNGHGFLRYSNGKVWPEYLADMMKSSLEVRAWSGAMSGMGNYHPNARDWSGLLWQVENYTPQTDMKSTLVVAEIGTNDLHDSANKVSAAQVVNNLVTAMGMLAAKGIRQMVVWNLNASLVSPGYTDENSDDFEYYKGKKDQATALFKAFNLLIAKAVDDFNNTQDNMQVTLFDHNNLVSTIKGRFKNTTTPWIDTRAYPEKGGWFWLDHWHYMTEVHNYLANAVFEHIAL